jgi:hypothetical protein
MAVRALAFEGLSVIVSAMRSAVWVGGGEDQDVEAPVVVRCRRSVGSGRNDG